MVNTNAPAIGPEKRIRSVSQLNDWLWCAWAYRLKRIVKVPERPAVWLPGGTAFHATTEAFDLSTWQETDLSGWADPEPWHNVFEQEFEAGLDELREKDPDESNWRTAGKKTAAKPNGEDAAWWRDFGKGLVTNYIDWRISTADTLRIATVEGGPGIEVEVLAPMGDAMVVCKIDRVMQDVQTGNLAIMDLKTGTSTPDSPVQLATYSLHVEALVGRPVVWGYYYDARKAQLSSPTDLSTFTHDTFSVMYENLDRGVQTGAFVPNIGRNCFGCGFKSSCVYVGGHEPARQES